MDAIFDIVAKDKLFGKLAHHHRLLAILRENTNTLLGQLHKHIFIVDVREDTLILETSNPIWVSEIKRYEKMILGRLGSLLASKLGKEYPLISRIKVIISSKKPNHKEPLVNNQSRENKEVSLEMMVMNENEGKRNRGFLLCRSCADILTDEGICVFCRSLGKRL